MSEEQLNQQRIRPIRTWKNAMWIILVGILLFYLLFRPNDLFRWGKWLVELLNPILVGIVLAFFLNIPVRTLENSVLWKEEQSVIKRKMKRGISLSVVVILVLCAFSLLMFLIVPELIRSLSSLSEKAPGYTVQLQQWIQNIFAYFSLNQKQIDTVMEPFYQMDWSILWSGIKNFTSDFVGSVVNVMVKITSGMFRFIFSFILALYMIVQKESLIRNLRRVLYAFLPWKLAKRTIEVGQMANQIFSGFVSGQCLEALIIGLLCYLGMGILGLPYAVLISAVVAFTSLIPVFGAYFGAGFGAVILLTVRPWDSILFLIFLIVLQNVEGNFIYPKVVGSSVGLPGLWVIVSILIFGDLFGIWGMLLGVPVCSLLYQLFRQATNIRLRKKHISDWEAAENKVGLLTTPVLTRLMKDKTENRKK